MSPSGREPDRISRARIYRCCFVRVVGFEPDLPHGRQKLIFRIRPLVPTNHPAFGLANATAQYQVTPGSVNQVVPSSGVQAAPPALAVTTTVLLPSPLPTPCE